MDKDREKFELIKDREKFELLGERAKRIYNDRKPHEFKDANEFLAGLKECLQKNLDVMAEFDNRMKIYPGVFGYPVHIGIDTTGDIRYNVKYKEFFMTIREDLRKWLEDQEFYVKESKLYYLVAYWANHPEST